MSEGDKISQQTLEGDTIDHEEGHIWKINEFGRYVS